MKLKHFLCLLIIALVMPLSFISCEDKEDPIDKPGPGPEPTEKTDNEITNEWIYDRMKRVYLWNDKLPASPNYTINPKNFFYGILFDYKKATGDRFSWIEEDESKGVKDTKEGTSLGFTYMPNAYFDGNSETSSVGFFVTSVRDGSDAEKQGLKRGQLIYKVDNTIITAKNYSSILEKGSFTLSIYNEKGNKETCPLYKQMRQTTLLLF